MNEKTCTKCGETKSLESFSRNSRARDGRRSECKDCVRVRYHANVECQRAYEREWRKVNADRRREHKHTRRARKAAAFQLPNYPLSRLPAFWQGHGIPENTCAYCPTGSYEHLDHVVPLSKNGAHALFNLLPACDDCNLSKSAADPLDWIDRRLTATTEPLEQAWLTRARAIAVVAVKMHEGLAISE